MAPATARRSAPFDPRAVAGALEAWFPRAARPLPWRTDLATPSRPRDPWHCLVAEAMLQQTQVARVLGPFARFIAEFPTPAHLARAEERRVLALWAGLGYYRRARNLHAAARAIVQHHAGRLPDDPAALGALPGVGRYSAGAIASIAFNRPEPILDGNVRRVLLRLRGVAMNPANPATDRWAWARAADIARAADRPGVVNEALMELGATTCTPGPRPACDACPLAHLCAARAAGTQARIPRPKPAPTRSALWLACIIISDRRGRVLIRQRPPSGLWAGLWQPPTLELDAPPRDPHTAAAEFARPWCAGPLRHAGTFSALLTHRRLTVAVFAAPAAACTRRAAAQHWAAPAELLAPAPEASHAMSNLHKRAVRLALTLPDRL